MNVEKHLLIPKIQEGIVIDHIPAGIGPRILTMIRSYPEMDGTLLTLGLNYGSKKLGAKDMLKLFRPDLPAKLLDHISLIAPGVSIKRIVDYGVEKRYGLEPPTTIEEMVRCINPNCISNNERDVRPRFRKLGTGRKYRCAFCERVFKLDELEIVLP